MRLMSFRAGGRARFGLATDAGVVDLTERLAGEFASLDEVARANAFEKAGAAGVGKPLDFSFDDVEFLPPLARPGKIFCIGVNYGKRNEEYGQVAAPSKYPNVFMRTPESLVGHRGAIARPHVSEQLDYEGEIVLVIGREGRYIARDAALGHIAGLAIANEGTIRDWMTHGRFNITQGKNFDRSGSIGPWIDTAPVLSTTDFHLRTWVNDELRQDDTTANMIWRFDFLIHYLSQFATLSPGDIILTGTPVGAGARFDPPKWLRPGDRLKIEVSGLGVLENTIVDETFSRPESPANQRP
jgi:2-keto-4-pentenoate hydratase/2-oxohepta-3-ene-1,7-dioic acid hydratase in catechol pathway